MSEPREESSWRPGRGRGRGGGPASDRDRDRRDYNDSNRSERVSGSNSSSRTGNSDSWRRGGDGGNGGNRGGKGGGRSHQGSSYGKTQQGGTTDRRQDWWSDSSDSASSSRGGGGRDWRGRSDNSSRGPSNTSRSSSSAAGTDARVDVSRYRLLSKLDHGDTSGDNLKHRPEQEKLFSYIREKMAAGDPASDITLLFRKLREGITASGVQDGFVADVYTEAAWFAFDANDLSEFHVCLVNLATRIYPALKPPRSADWDVCLGHLILYFACCVPRGMHEVDQTMRKMPTAQQQSSPVRAALRVAASIDVADYYTFERLRRSAKGRDQSLMDRARARVQLQALDILRKAYVTLELDYLALDILGCDSVGACRKLIDEHFELPATAYGTDGKAVVFKNWKIKA